MPQLFRAPARLLAVTTAVALVTAGVFVGAPAYADTAPKPGVVETVSTDPLPTVQIDGVVWSQAIVGNTVYVGGDFANARPAGSAPGQNTVGRTNLLAYNLTTGELIGSFNPTLNGIVKTVTASPDGKRVYIGGQFTQVNGQKRYRIAAFDTAGGSLVSGFAPVVNSTIETIKATDTKVYFGGNFTDVGGASRGRIAAVNASNGTLLPYQATADGGRVRGIGISPDGSKVVLAGAFTTLNGSANPGYGMGATDATTGQLLPWAANEQVRNGGANAAIYSLTSDNDGVYGTGYHFGSGGNVEGVFRVDWDGNLVWLADCHGDTYSAATTSDSVYIAGHPHACENPGAFPQTEPTWTFQRGMAWSKAWNGNVNKGITHGYANWQGTRSPDVLNFWPDFNVGTKTGASQGPWTVSANENYVLYGGEFTVVNNSAQQGLVRFAKKSIAPNRDGPRLSGSKWTPNAVSLVRGSVRLSWLANYDRDNQYLTYDLIRDGKTSTPIYTTNVGSRIWFDRPTMTFTDTGLEPGSTHTYRLRATDPFGNQVLGNSVSVTVSTDGTLSDYAKAVIGDGATSFWRLSETGGTAVYDWAGGNDGTAGTGVTRGTAGAINGDPNTASTFSGTADGLVGTQTEMQGPDTFTTEAWFKTTSTSGGKIVGFGSSNEGLSGSYDRHVYMDGDGRVRFGVYPNDIRTVESAPGLNDGQWHYVAASLSSAGMQLYIDGKLVSSRSDTTNGQDYLGYWRIGGDNSWSGDQWFDGDIDDVAVYTGKTLTKAQIGTHFSSSGRTVAGPGVATDPYGSAVVEDGANSYWRLGEANGSDVYDWAGSNDGIARSGVSRGAQGAIAGTSNTASTFSGDGEGYVGTKNAMQGPNTFTAEAWFKTTSTSGGKIVGFGSRNDGESDAYDRHVFMNDQGRVVFGVYPNDVRTVQTDTAYNDGEWHYVAASLSGSGMQLYIDGKRVASRSDTTWGQDYWGFWRIGGDRSWGGDSWFDGSIDEVAVYTDRILTPSQIQQHYKLSGRTLDAPAVPTDRYGSAVIKSGPSIYWRMSEAGNASTAVDYSGNGRDGVYRRGVQKPVDGALAGTTNPAARFDGQGGSLASTERLYNPTNYSTELWFKTDTRTGGKLIGFGNREDDLSSGYDRHTFLRDDGRLVFGAWTGFENTITTDNAYNDDAWHHVVSTQSSDGMKLYVDGRLVGTNPQTGAENSWGFWKVGGDPTWGSSSPWVRADIDEAAVYDHALSADEVAAHHAAGLPEVVTPPNSAPVAAFSTNVADLKATFDAGQSTDSDGTVASYAWAFGDGATGTGVTSEHTFSATGSYDVTLTVTDDDGATAQLTKQVQVVAPNKAPTAAATVTPNALTVTADGTGSSDSDGSIVSYAWTFGDGATADGATATHSYADSGSYTVTLTVTDDRGASSTKETTVSVTKPVVASVWARDSFSRSIGSGLGDADLGGAWTLSGRATGYGVENGTAVLRTARGITLSASLDSVRSSDTEARTTVAFLAPTNTFGAAAYASVVGRKTDTGDYRARVVVNSAGEVTLQLQRGTTTLRSQRIAGMSYKQGDRLDVRFQTKGTAPTTLNAKVWVRGSAEPTDWQVTTTDSTAGLQAAGAVGLVSYVSSTATTTVPVTFDDFWAGSTSGSPAAPVNTPPTAKFVATPADLSVAFDASSSTDADGSVVGYAWDFGDGSAAQGGTTQHSYAVAGNYTVRLTVTDNVGATSSTEQTITVTAPANAAPVAAFEASASGLTASMDGSGSRDSDGSVRSYDWNFGDGSTGSGATTTRTYATAGTYTVTLTVTDDRGATATTSKSVSVAETTTPPVENVLAKDDFERTSSAGWGSALAGGTWSGASSAFSTAGVGRIQASKGGLSLDTYLGSVNSSATRTEATVSFDSIGGGSRFGSVIGRKTADGSYRTRVVVNQDGKVNLQLLVNGTTLTSRATDIVYAPNDKLRVVIETVGTSPTTIRAKVWRADAAEPTDWFVSTTDSNVALQSSGQVGLGFYLGSAATPVPASALFDDFVAREVK